MNWLINTTRLMKKSGWNMGGTKPRGQSLGSKIQVPIMTALLSGFPFRPMLQEFQLDAIDRSVCSTRTNCGFGPLLRTRRTGEGTGLHEPRFLGERVSGAGGTPSTAVTREGPSGRSPEEADRSALRTGAKRRGRGGREVCGSCVRLHHSKLNYNIL